MLRAPRRDGKDGDLSRCQKRASQPPAPLSGSDLRFRADQLARVFTDRGVTFAYAGEERPFPLDLIPRIIDAVEWDMVTRAVRQRVTALEMFLADVYGRSQVLDDGVVPRRLVTTSAPDW